MTTVARRGSAWLRWLGWIVVAFAAVLAAFHLWYAAQILWWRSHPVGETSFMAHRMDELRAKNPKATLRYTWVPYDRISGNLKRAMVAAEDAKFVEHEGFDWEGIQLAIEKNQRKGRVVAGGSTITQQLAKNLWLSGERTWWRKAREASIALVLDACVPKKRILEVYLSAIEWGERTWGCEAAARSLFQVPASRLNAQQAAAMAAMIPSPGRRGAIR